MLFRSTSGKATAWNPNPDGYELEALAVSGQTVYAGGWFSIGGRIRELFAEFLVPRPSNHFLVSHLQSSPDGTVAFWVRVPWPGRIEVMATAWNSNLAQIAMLLQPAPGRFVFARALAITTHPSTLRLRVTPNRQGKRLVTRHTYQVTLRLWITYTPATGRPLSVGFYHLLLGCRSPLTYTITPSQGARPRHIKASTSCR